MTFPKCLINCDEIQWQSGLAYVCRMQMQSAVAIVVVVQTNIWTENELNQKVKAISAELSRLLRSQSTIIALCYHLSSVHQCFSTKVPRNPEELPIVYWVLQKCIKFRKVQVPLYDHQCSKGSAIRKRLKNTAKFSDRIFKIPSNIEFCCVIRLL